tara:strand:- start:3997 stop:4758 length:762 start_codon:yes stop_codon:yes gene_type:complete
MSDISPQSISPDLDSVLLNDTESAFCELDELVESFENRLTLDNLRLGERYCKGKLKFLAEARWASMNFNIVIERAHLFESCGGSCVHHEGGATDPCTKEANISFWSDKNAWQAHFGGNLDRGSAHHDNSIVLVDNIEPVQNPCWVVPSFVSLKPKDKPLGFGTDALYFGYRSGFTSFGIGANVKPLVCSVSVTIGADQVTYSKIESGPEIVSNVANDTANFDWDVFVDNHADDVFAALGVCVKDDVVWIERRI